MTISGDIDTVIFDLDGTLLDTLDDLTDSVNYALVKCGLPERDRKDIRCFLGNGAEVLMKNAIEGRLSDEESDECIQVFKE